MSRARSPLLPIFLIVLVDVLGFTIVIPLLPLYAETFGASPLVATTIFACYAACSLVSTPVIGSLSDRYGRKPLLLISQAGTCAGFLMLGFAGSLWMVFAGRILDGITAGNLATAQAYISDHTKPEDRAKAFGIIGVAFGIGFLFGPWLGGELGDYGVRTIGDVPFLVSAGLSALSMVCTATLLPRERPPEHGEGQPAALPGGKRPSAFDVAVYREYFRRPRLGNLYLQFFLFIFAFSAFTSGFAMFAEQRFGWGTRQTGYLFAYAGLLGIILQGGLIGRLVKRFGEVPLALAGLVAGVLGYPLLGVAQSLLVLLASATVVSFSNGVLRPVLTSQISQAVGRHEQGIAIGISGSLSSLAMTMAPVSAGVMLEWHSTLGWALVSTTFMTLALIAALAGRTTKTTGVRSPGELHSPS
jgi:MFS family permease